MLVRRGLGVRNVAGQPEDSTGVRHVPWQRLGRIRAASRAERGAIGWGRGGGAYRGAR